MASETWCLVEGVGEHVCGGVKDVLCKIKDQKLNIWNIILVTMEVEVVEKEPRDTESEQFCYLDLIINMYEEFGDDLIHRIEVVWLKWKGKS